MGGGNARHPRPGTTPDASTDTSTPPPARAQQRAQQGGPRAAVHCEGGGTQTRGSSGGRRRLGRPGSGTHMVWVRGRRAHTRTHSAHTHTPQQERRRARAERERKKSDRRGAWGVVTDVQTDSQWRPSRAHCGRAARSTCSWRLGWAHPAGCTCSRNRCARRRSGGEPRRGRRGGRATDKKKKGRPRTDELLAHHFERAPRRQTKPQE